MLVPGLVACVICIVALPIAVITTVWFTIDPIMLMSDVSESSWYYLSSQWWSLVVWGLAMAAAGASSIMVTATIISNITPVGTFVVKHLAPQRRTGLAVYCIGTLVLCPITIGLVMLISLELFSTRFPTRFTISPAIYMYAVIAFIGTVLFCIGAAIGIKSCVSGGKSNSHLHLEAMSRNIATARAEELQKATDADSVAIDDFAMADFVNLAPDEGSGSVVPNAYAQTNYDAQGNQKFQKTGVPPYSMSSQPLDEKQAPIAAQTTSEQQPYDPYRMEYSHMYRPYEMGTTNNSSGCNGGAIPYGISYGVGEHRYARCNVFCIPNPQTGQLVQAFQCSNCHQSSSCTICGQSFRGNQPARSGHLCQRCNKDFSDQCARCSAEPPLDQRHPVQICQDCSPYNLDTACVRNTQQQ